MAKEQLLAAVEGGDKGSFLNLIHAHESKRKAVNLGEVLSELSRTQVDQTWKVLHTWANSQLTAFVADEEQSRQDLGGGEEEQCDKASSTTGNLQKDPTEVYDEKVLEAVVQFACIYLRTLKDGIPYIPTKLVEMAVLLHEMVGVLESRIQTVVVSLCEMWWLQSFECKELLMAKILPLLVETATRKGAQKKDVVRLWVLRDALNTIDLCSPNSENFVRQLICCISCPNFLSCDEGVKWLAGLFSWPSLIDPLHQEVRMAILECTRPQSAKYGEIYFRAWKVSQWDRKKILEEDCLQDLMYTAIHVNPRSGRPSANLHHLLHHIHTYKKYASVSTLIYELYQPILWRSLKAANGYVRMNAAGLLCDAFPLSNQSFTQEEQEDLLQKQYHTLTKLLMDPCHLVRITTIKGVFSILSKYWLMVPSDIIKAIFKTFLTVLVYDISSADVRMEVVKGLTLLLDSGDAVPFLSEVLLRLGDMFDDSSLNVRTAFAKLLLKVKASKAIKYWDIVPVQHLLHRLELDEPQVGRQITRLLLSSFHPTSKSDQELLQRSLALLEENRMAARQFYQYASSMIDLPSTVHFMMLLWLCLRNYVAMQHQQHESEEEENESNEGMNSECDQRAKGSRPKPHRGSRRSEWDSSVSTSNKENTAKAPGTVSNQANTPGKDRNPNKAAVGGDEGEEVEEDESESENSSPLDDPEVVGGILDTVVILWTTNASRLAQPQNFKYLEALRTKISKNLHLLFKFFKGNHDASCTLLYLSSFLPKSLVPTLVGHCMSHLRMLETEQVLNGNDLSYKMYINALCNWNRVIDVLELISEWLEESFKSGLSTNNKERRRVSRRVRFCETSTPKPRVALRFLRHILEHPLNKTSTMQRCRQTLLEVTHNIGKVKDLISERLQQDEELSTLCCDKFLNECWSLYLHLMVVCHKCPPEDLHQEKEPEDLHLDSPAYFSQCLDWASDMLVPYLGEEDSGKRKLRNSEEAAATGIAQLKALVTSSTHLLMTGAAKLPFVYKLNGFVKTLLETDAASMFWETSLFLASEAYQFLWVYETYQEEEDEELEKVSPTQLANVCISSISDYLKHQEHLPKESSELNNTLVSLLVCFGQHSRQDQAEVLVHMMHMMVEHLIRRIDKKQDVDKEIRSVQDLGVCVAMLMDAFRNQTKLSIAAMDALSHFINTAVRDIRSLLAVCHLLKVVLGDTGKISRYCLKEAVMAVISVKADIITPQTDIPETPDESSLRIHEDYTKAAQEIIEDLKTSLNIV